MVLSWSSVGFCLLAAATIVGVGASCADPKLERPPPPVVTVDNELALQGTVCSSPPKDAVFPVKILFIVDTSGSMIVTDPALVRVQGVNAVINKYKGLPGVEFGVLTFSSALVNVTNGFTDQPNLTAIDTAISVADDLTDTQGALSTAYEILSTDMLKSTPAERARSKYILIFFTDGIPDPLCSADKTPCGKGLSCKPGTHCVPTTILSPSSMEEEHYECDDDYLICSVPKKNWGSAFNPPLSPSLYPQLMAGGNYNTTPQIIAAVDQIMGLAGQYHVGSITLNTNFLFPVDALSNPLAAPFDLDRPAGDALLMAMAAAGNGVFQEFTDDTQINFLNISFASLQVNNSLVQSYVANQMTQEIGSGLVLDSDGDGLTDTQEATLGTCAALSAKCPTPWDSDGDGYSDFLEVKYKTSGFDPLDPTKPATPCLMPGQDSDGDGLMDCEEAFLKTESLNPDTDGDYLSDLQEVRHGMDPLNPADANGDINRDGILNEPEIKMGLTPSLQVAPSEMSFAYGEQFIAQPSNGSTTGTCYDFSLQHIRLMTTAATPTTPQGYNRVYYDVFETPMDSPTNFSTVRRACADVLFVNGKFKIPLTGTVNFVDSDFVDIRQFDPTKNCKDLTQGVAGVDGGSGGTTPSVDGGKD
jgi:von Willebrand factor type A domain/Bacterial TSP3 repeat